MKGKVKKAAAFATSQTRSYATAAAMIGELAQQTRLLLAVQDPKRKPRKQAKLREVVDQIEGLAGQIRVLGTEINGGPRVS